MKSKTEIPLIRFLAKAGFGSRRHCDQLVIDGLVTVNDTTADIGTRVNPVTDVIKVKGQIAEEPPVLLYMVLFKPKGYLVSDSDPEGRPLAKDLLPDFQMRMFPVGRLDFQTEGAILFTNDGVWANDIAHPRNVIPKRYLAKVRNIPTRQTLNRWLTGIKDKGQVLKASHVSVEKTTAKNAWLMITLTGGANRQVRRMGQATGHPVVKLVRLSVGDVDIENMKPGDTRDLTVKEVKSFKNYSNKHHSEKKPALNSKLKKRISTSRRKKSRAPQNKQNRKKR